MPHVVTSPCVYTKDSSCMRVCPVPCFFDAGQMLVIHPEECVDCGLCVPECPVSSIFPDDEVPERDKAFVRLNRMFFEGGEMSEVNALMAAARKSLASVTEGAKRAKIDAFLKNKAVFSKAKGIDELERLRQSP